jgi:tetratricopeptide (TPR) repeat protein
MLPGGNVYGPNAGFNISAPEGWVVDNESGKGQDLPCVLYPKGSSWSDAKTVMYAKLAGPQWEDVNAFEAMAIKEMKAKHGTPREKIAAGKTKDDLPYFINEYPATKNYSKWERVGYIQLFAGVAYIVLSSRDETSYRKDSDALEKVVKTLIYFDPKSEATIGQFYAHRYSFLTSLHADAQIETLLTEWREKAPKDPEAWITSANYYFKERQMMITTDEEAGSISSEQSKENIKRAADLLQEATTKFPDRLDIWCELASIYQESGDFDNELSTLKEMVAYAREHPAQLKWEGKPLSEPDEVVPEKVHNYGLYYEKKDRAEDDKRWSQIAALAVQQYPESVRVLFNLGNRSAEMKDFLSAQKYFEEALKLDPNGKYAQEAKEALQRLQKITGWLPPSLQAKDIVIDKSPDGNFALRVQLPKEAGDQPKIGMINLLTQEAVVELDCPVHCYQGNAKPKLLWFSDSQRVAYYTPHDQGGYTQVYFRRGSSFEEVQLPTIPNLKFPRQGSVDEQAITKISEPKRWLKSGALVLHQEQERLAAGSAAQKVTIGFDRHGRGSVLKVEEKKVAEDPLVKDPQLLVLPSETAYFRAIASDSINNLTVRILDRDGKLHQGDNETSIEFRGTKARLVDVGKVNLQIDNNMPGKQIHRDVVVERTATRGLYRAKIQVESGDWNMKISYDGPHGKGETTFPVLAQQ